MTVISIASILYFRQERKKKVIELKANKEKLIDFTKLLAVKNKQIQEQEIARQELEEKVKSAELGLKINEAEEKIIDYDLFHKPILTSDDWELFKKYFDKVYPGFIHRVRQTYPTITEAEERLFLFIKLSITNNEASEILGISADSVKKSRTRLRKKLELDKEIKLNEFIQRF